MFLRTRLFKVSTVAILVILLIMPIPGLTLQARPNLQDKPPFCPPFISFINPLNPIDIASTQEATPAATAEVESVPESCHLMAVLRGTDEVPKTGDPDATGMFLGYYNTKTDKLCYEIDVANIGAATAAHIHMGGAGEAGAVFIPLIQPNARGTVANCLPTNAKNNDLLKNILANPTGFYVNVHNKEFPDGALRGQLVGAANLNGMREVPGPGDPRGYGVGSVVYDATTKRLCTMLFVRGIQLPATAAHIHQGAANEAG